jgi:hypothetical protein
MCRKTAAHIPQLRVLLRHWVLQLQPFPPLVPMTY